MANIKRECSVIRLTDLVGASKAKWIKAKLSIVEPGSVTKLTDLVGA